MSDEINKVYDTKGYSESLEKLVAMSEKEYYVHLVDINRHQVVVAKILLWLAVVLLGFDIALIDWSYNKVFESFDLIKIITPCYIFLTLSITTSVIAFSFAGLAIPAFGGYDLLYKNSWADYSNEAYDNFINKEDLVYVNTLNNLLSNLDLACSKGNLTNASRGAKLRTSSIFIIISAILSGCGFIAFSFNYYL